MKKMKNNSFYVTMILFLFIATITSCNSDKKENSSTKPNIIIIMADDMGYSDIGSYGGETQTPNLDRLASQGIRFTQFYNAARCCPTRASLLTGLYPHQTGVGHMMWSDPKLPGYQGDLNTSCVTIAEVLKENGYSTYMSGKWHVTKQVGHWSGEKELTSKHNWPIQRGFDRFYGTIHGGGSFYDPVSLTRDNTPIIPDKENYYYTDAISDNAVQFLNDHKSNDPFFMYVAYTAPHWPLHALPDDIKKYKGKFDKGWDELRKERYNRMIKMGIIDPSWELTKRDKSVPEWENAEDKDWQAHRMEVYAAQIDNMDQGIGRIIKELEKSGKLNNTLIFFLTDNGGTDEGMREEWKAIHFPTHTRKGKPVMKGNEFRPLLPGPENTYQSYGAPWANLSNTPFRLYKHWVHEGGIATPLIMHWPEHIKANGELRNQPGHIIDIMATCVDVASAEYPAKYKGNEITPLEGKSLIPVFENKQIKREAIFWEHEGNKAIRKGKWKLVMDFKRNSKLGEAEKNQWELYDIENDKTEMNNLALQYPDRVKQMADLWEQWAYRTNVLPGPWDEK